MTDIKIVKIEERHLEDIAEIEKSCFSHPWSSEALKTLISENGIGFCAIDPESERAVSYAGMIMSLYDGDITDVATLPSFRRRGYSRAVMEALISFAGEKGLEDIALEVRASNEGAILLYEGLGFDRAGVRKNFYRTPTEDAIIMIKKLK